LKIANIKVKNYRNIDGIDIKFNPECNYIIGENNTGKSNCLSLLDTVCNGKNFDDKDFADSNKPIEVKMKIKLMENEKGIFGDKLSINDDLSMDIRYKQEIDDTPIINRNESEENIQLKQLKKIHFMRYDSTLAPSKELRLDTQRGLGSVMNSMINRFIDSPSGKKKIFRC
jgi:putative ATP-dependent endonuclease of OLD family